MSDSQLTQELRELLADLRDLAGSLASSTPVRCRQLLALTNSVERHFEHLLRCNSAGVTSDSAGSEARATNAPSPSSLKKEKVTIEKGGARDRDRTCDPHHVKVMLYR